MKKEKALVWFRRDLRDHDHAALKRGACRGATGELRLRFRQRHPGGAAIKTGPPCAFHPRIAGQTEPALRAKGGGLIVRHGRAVNEIPELAKKLGVEAVFANATTSLTPNSATPRVWNAESCRNCISRLQGPGDLRWRRGADPGWQTVLSVQPVQKCLAEAVDRCRQRKWPCNGSFSGGELAGVPALDDIGFVATNLADLNMTRHVRRPPVVG